jgi:CarD family transcriptional regulator
MYEVGEYIVHPGQGVCKIDEIVEEPQVTYLLLPITPRNPMRISFPAAREDRLRPVLSRKEAEEIIDDYPTMKPELHEERSNALEEQYFKDEMRNGDCRDSVRIVKTFRMRIHELKAHNKKPPVAYERILKTAVERSLSELSVALQRDPADVVTLFEASAAESLLDN